MVELDKYWDNIHLKYNSSYDGWLNKYISLFDKDASIIDLGCGRAYSSNYLLDKGFKNVIACDFSLEVLKIVKNDNKDLKTKLFDMSLGLPFEDASLDVVIADLSLHYFDLKTTEYVFDEIYRVLKNNGYLIARVNSVNDKLHVPTDAQEIEKNYFFDGNVYKRFFAKSDFDLLFNKFMICNLEEKCMERYEKPKILWEFCIQKVEDNKND